MAPTPIPALLDPDAYMLALTPGTYSSLVQEAWGAYDPETDTDLAAADDAAMLVSAMGDDPFGATDAIGALSTVGSQITQNNGAQISAQLAPATAAVSAQITDFQATSGVSASQTTPAQPSAGAPTGLPQG